MFSKFVIVILLVYFQSCESRIRYKYRKRPECRDQVPRRVDELSSILVTGVIETTFPPVQGSELYSASVHVKSVLRGPKTLQETRITVAGFGDTRLCHATTTRGDSWIFSLEQVADGLLKLNGTLLKVNLNNLDRLSALTAGKIKWSISNYKLSQLFTFRRAIPTKAWNSWNTLRTTVLPQ